MITTEQTPLDQYFEARGIARIGFAPGLTTPAFFTDPALEHQLTRRMAGLFDFSFMACVEFKGRDASAFVHALQTRNLTRLRTNRIAYTLLLREDGSVLNDATVWRMADDSFYLFVGRRGDVAHIMAHAQGFDVRVSDRSRQQAVFAVQGPKAWHAICRCFAASPPPELPYYGFAPIAFEGMPCFIARVGYSGETGYELIAPAEIAPGLWEALRRAGADTGLAECGFKALDSLRIEAGHILFLRELATPLTPFEIGLSRLVDFYRGPFTGGAKLWPLRWRTPERRLVGLIIERQYGQTLPTLKCASRSERESGIASGTARLTSVCHSPIFNRLLGLGFTVAADSQPGASVKIGSDIVARVVRRPYYDPPKFLARHTR